MLSPFLNICVCFNAMKVLQTLNSAHAKARRTAAAVIAKIAKIEIPRGLWPNLIDTLLAASLSQALEAKQAALETLGYICEELVRPAPLVFVVSASPAACRPSSPFDGSPSKTRTYSRRRQTKFSQQWCVL